MIVCCDTLQISAASPVVKTVFMADPHPLPKFTGKSEACPHSLKPDRRSQHIRVSVLIHLLHLTIGSRIWQLEQDRRAEKESGLASSSDARPGIRVVIRRQ